MAKDSLARGASSAIFMGGTPGKDDPIEFHGTVATEKEVGRCEHGHPLDRQCFLCISAQRQPEPKKPIDFSRYQPLNERVLIRRIEQEQGAVVIPDAFRQQSPKGEVVCASEDAFPVKVGDIVYFGEYNAEPIDIEGETLHLVAVADIRMKVLASSPT